jgi:hypothetical protein
MSIQLVKQSIMPIISAGAVVENSIYPGNAKNHSSWLIARLTKNKMNGASHHSSYFSFLKLHLVRWENAARSIRVNPRQGKRSAKG